jgi:uncharacterized protein (DUF697 family)
VNRSVLLHIVERFEALVSRLPVAIQRAVRAEFTPIKELFLQQRAPRFLLAGSARLTLPELVNILFNGEPAEDSRHILFEVFRWQTLQVKNRGTICVLDARGADNEAEKTIRDELRREPADVIILVSDAADSHTRFEQAGANGIACVRWNDEVSHAGIVAVHLRSGAARNGHADPGAWENNFTPQMQRRVWGSFEFAAEPVPAGADRAISEQLISLIAAKLPNECRVEMVRISRNRQAQRDIANVLIKSTTAICSAVGAQPIPLADLPVLTALQLAMISGVMYVSGRERSLRAATEFAAAIGANVGAGMLLREGARALLKFFPGWGNVVCGAIAGAGTYAIGHAATAYFLEGATLSEARRAYLQKRRRKKPEALQLK